MSKVNSDNLGQWLSSIGVVDQFTGNDLESGRTVINLIRAIIRDSKIQLLGPNSAINRVTNWGNIIEELKKVGVRITQQEKGKIINGNHDLIFHIISKLRQIHQRSQKETQINISDINPKKDLKDASSLLQLFILALIKNFTLSPKEALSLLSNDGKYLAHILAKGLKGDFKPVDLLITDLFKQLARIKQFSKNKENENFFLKSIKPALICKSDVVSESCLNLIRVYMQGYDRSMRVQILNLQLMSTMLLITRRHPHLNQKVMSTIFEMSEYNPDVLSSIINSSAKNDLNNTFMLVWNIFEEKNKLAVLQRSKQLSSLIQQTIEGLKQPDNILSTFHVILQVSKNNIDIFGGQDKRDDVMNGIAAASFSKQAQNIVFVHQCFTLLSISGESKHPIAPTLWKIMVSKFLNCKSKEQMELYLKNFSQIIRQFPLIPYLTVVETLSQKMQSGNILIRECQVELFESILLGQNVEFKAALLIYNLCSKCLIEDVGYGVNLVKVLAQVIEMFRKQQIILDMTIKLIKVSLAVYFAKFKKLTEKRKSMSLKNKLDPDQALAKLKMLELQYFLRSVVDIKEDNINSNIEALLCFTYIQINDLSKEYSKGLQKIIKKLGKFEDLVAKYEKEIREEQDGQNLHQSKVKNNQSQNRYEEDQGIANTNNSYSIIKKTKRSATSHPKSLSFAAVYIDAHKGIEKYSKIHLKKIENEDLIKQKQLQEQQAEKKLKKLYNKQIMPTKGLIFKGVDADEVQYLFQFDSKERYIQKQGDNLIYFNNESEEDRDIIGLQNILKRYQKVLKVYFNQYSGKKNGFLPKYFEEISQKQNFIHTSGIMKLFKDHGIDDYITLREIQILVKKVNYKFYKGKDKEDFETLDFQRFKQFILQACYTMFTRPPKDLRGHPVSEMIEQMLSTLKLYAGQNRISTALFEDPDAFYTNEAQAVKALNKKLKQNPDYILPEGYQKIVDKKVYFDYKIYLEAMSVTYKEVYEVVDELIYNAFKIHLIEPFTKEEKIYKARPNVYLLERFKIPQNNEKHITAFLKKQLSKFPMNDRQIAKDAADAITDIIQAVQLNHDQIGLKHQNMAIKTKKQKQELERKAIEQFDKKRNLRDKQVKTVVEQYKQKKQTQRENQEKAKKQQLQKRKEQKQKRQKREKQLKQKLQDFNQKKKQEEEKKKQQAQLKAQKQKQEAERKKRESEQIKKKIEQAKRQKQQAQKQKKRQEKQEQKKRKQQQKRKFEESQKQKKQRIEQYKQKKNGGSTVQKQVKAMDAKEGQQN